MARTFINPLTELQQMIDAMDQAFSTSWPVGEAQRQSRESVLALNLDIWEKEGHYYVRAAMPGVPPEKLDVQVRDGILSLSGESVHDALEDKTAKFWRLEIATGRFARSIRLPDNVYVDGIEAEFENGFVTVKLPMMPERHKSIQVAIKGAGTSTPKALETKTEKSNN